MFGIMIVDIEVPPEYYNYFSEYPTIIVNLNITRSVPEGKSIKERKLVSVYKAEKILLITPLLHWYLNHGVRLIKIQGYIPATPLAIYKGFGDWIEMREEMIKLMKLVKLKQNVKN